MDARKEAPLAAALKAPAATPPAFDAAFRDRLDTLFAWRRDVRCFRPDPLDEELVHALLATACRAPSVGYSQPWRLVRVRDSGRRAAIRALFETANAQALAQQPEERASLYARLKLAGLDDAPEHLAVFVEPDPAAGHGLGRATMPETVAYSAVLAIHTLWLAAAARGIGVGWVSILDPDDLKHPSLRGHEAGEHASRVAVHPQVRAALIEFQRDFAGRAPGAVLDGRDIGTAICPQAPVKIYVTASPEVRARRRTDELAAKGRDVDYERILAEIRQRDERDSGRSTAPLKPAEDAVILDTSDLDREGAFTAAIAIVDDKWRARRVG